MVRLMLTREQLMKPRRATREVKLADGSVLVRGLSARDALALEKAIGDAKGNLEKLLAVQLVAFVSDKDGNPLLSDEDAMTLLAARGPGEVRAICEAGMALNAFGADGVEAAGGN